MGEWQDLLAPHIAKFDAAYAAGGSTVYNAVGSQAMSKLLSVVGEKLDSAAGLLAAERVRRADLDQQLHDCEANARGLEAALEDARLRQEPI